MGPQHSRARIRIHSFPLTKERLVGGVRLTIFLQTRIRGSQNRRLLLAVLNRSRALLSTVPDHLTRRQRSQP